MKQAQKMQQQMAAAQAELAETEVTGTAGGGLVTVTITGSGDVTAVKIDPTAVDPDDVETLEDLVLAALHNAAEAVRELTDEKMGPLTAGLGGLGGGLGLAPCVLLVDEVDRADDEFEAYLLEILADAAITIPELGRIAAATPPTVVVTSNRTRDVHDALKRRCLYHWVAHPDPVREARILRLRLPEVTERLAMQVATATAQLRELDLVKPPGVAEAIDWAAALRVLVVDELTPEAVAASLGVVLKVREDLDRVRELPPTALLGAGP